MKEAKIEAALKPGRPMISDSKKLLMRREIAEVAKRLFQEEGYGKVSVRRIAAEIGCSPMTLYKYYNAKIDILRTLWADVFNDLFDQLEAVPKTGKGQLQALGIAYVRYWLDHTEYYRLVFIADGVTQSDVSVFIDNPELVVRFNIFTQALALSSKEPKLDELKVKFDAFMCFLNGIAHNLITMSDYQWSDPDKMVAMAVNAVLD